MLANVILLTMHASGNVIADNASCKHLNQLILLTGTDALEDTAERNNDGGEWHGCKHTKSNPPVHKLCLQRLVTAANTAKIR